MAYLQVEPARAELGLRALRAVAMADGELHDLERQLLDAVQKHVLGTSHDVTALADLEASELAGAFEGEMAEGLLHAGVVVAMIDGEASEQEGVLLEAMGKALGVKSQAVKDVQRLVHHHLRLLRIDLLRRSFIGQRIKNFVGQRGFAGILSVGRGVLGKAHAPTAEKYLALEGLPEGTLGRGFFEFTRSNQFNFPGEENGPPEPIVFHDCLHVLGEYGTSPLEETQIASFQAGMLKKDPVFGLMFMLAQFHLGLQITPVAEGQKMQANPELMLKGFLRGREVNTDLCVDWQPWDDFEVPIAELRERFNIPPRT